MEKDAQTKHNRQIKDMAVDDLPREKAIKYGVSALSTAELIALLLGSGSQGESVIDLSQRILYSADNKLFNLAKRNIKELTRAFKGVGDAKAITLLAALQLGKRLAEEGVSDESIIKDSISLYDYIRHDLQYLTHEEFWVILLKRSNRVIGKFRLTLGGVDSTIVDVKIIMKLAIENLASSIILVHNHPSNNSEPSDYDDKLTANISAAAAMLDMSVMDHLIVVQGDYYSYADNNRL
ncbi:MAG: DNA repair protein RadC [Bacteroidales bacterium]